MTRVSRILALLFVFILISTSLAEDAFVVSPPIEEEVEEVLIGLESAALAATGEEASADEEGEPTPEPTPEPVQEPTQESEPTLEITAEKTALIVGETLLLSVTFTPEDAAVPFILSSSDESVASVDADGRVTALGVGDVTITAQAENGLCAAITLSVEPVLPTDIALSFSEPQRLVKGRKLQLEATLYPEGAASKLTWTSSKADIATVSQKGLVKAKNYGTTIITVKTENGKRARVKIRVVHRPPFRVRLNYSDLQRLIKGKRLQLEATLYPEDAASKLTWTSSREDIATVSKKGLVKAKNYGTTIITVTTENGKRAKVKIKVVHRPPFRIRLNHSGTKLLAKGKKLRLKATLYPEDAGSKLTWTSSKEDIATVSPRGVVQAMEVGKTTITVTTENDKRAKVRIKVYDPEAVARVVAFRGDEEVSGQTIEMVAYDYTRFKARGYNAAGRRLKYEVAWTSSNTDVATIDDTGRLVTRGAGTTKIRAIMDGRKTSFIVKVLPPPNMIPATYKGTEFTVVNTRTHPVIYSELTFANTVCTRPNYGGRCLSFCYYYVRCMLAGVTEVSASEGARSGGPRNAASFRTEKYADYRTMMGRLYDLLNAGVPQIMMVEAVTHPGSRHFVVVVGYRSSVSGRGSLRPEDLLIIDSQDGQLESMDPAIDPFETRELFKQEGKYRIEAAKRG